MEVNKVLCRLCLQVQQRDVTPLFRDDECRYLRLQIMNLCSITILQDDNLPKFICWKCNIKLQDIYEFINMCKRSNKKLLEDYEEDKYCQISEGISLTEKKQKSIRGKECKSICKSLRSTKKSLRSHQKVLISSEIYNPDVSQDVLDENIRATELESDHAEVKSKNKVQKIPLKAQIVLNSNIRYEQLSQDNQKQYLCDICSKTFYSMSGLRFHLKSHHDSKQHVCQYCGKGFVFPSYKKRHERIHIGDNSFICHICSTSFKSSNGLKYHVRTHTGEANYHCDTCGKSFTRYKYLKEHTFTHTRQKPFVCKLCSSAYSSSGSLFAHEKKCKSR